jgi:flagellar hook-associated protein 2
MSGLSSTSDSGSSVTYGTNVAPISFPGIASGIDYNSIINKYTSMTIAQTTPLKSQVTKLNAQETELLKIQDLVSKLQDTFTAISDPANFNAYSATSTDTTLATPSSISGQTAMPGSYQILSTQLATATQITNDPAANATSIPNYGAPGEPVLMNAGTSVTPDNGTVVPAGQTMPRGSITIDGVTTTYDATTETLSSIVNRINNNLGGKATLTYDPTTGKATLTSSSPITLGSATDSGNLLSVLKLDTSPVTQSGSTYSVSSSTPIVGINQSSDFNSSNNAGFATAVTSGTFTINGVQFTVNATNQNLADVITQINQSSAGVIASYDPATGQISLTSKTSGPQSIALGSATDSSNFLQAAGFLQSATTPGTLSAGATETVGKAAVVTYIDPSGNTQTKYSNSNDVTNVIPGIDLKLLQSTPTGSNGFTVNVAQDTSTLESDINAFVTAYNAVIKEINAATVAPVVGSTTDSDSGQTVSGAITGGGVLFNNQDVLSLRDQLVSYVSEMGLNNSNTYNSLASIGLSLDSSFTVDVAGSSTSSSDSVSLDATDSADQTSLTTKTYQGTSGQLTALDTTKFEAALAANPTAVMQLFTAKNNPIYDLASYLTTATGLPTALANGAQAGTVPPQSLFSELTALAHDQIDSLQQQIALVTNQANMQADLLRAEFTDSESQIAQLQAEQQSLGALKGGS